MKAQTAIRALLGVVLFVALALPSSAQKRPSMAEVQAQMAQAQHMLDSVQKGIPKSAQQYMPKMPDMAKLQKTIDGSQQQVESYRAQAKQSRDLGLPKSGSASITNVPNATTLLVCSYAKDMLASATAGLKTIDPFLKQALDALATDSTITPAAQGMLLLSQHYPKCAVQYLVCKGMLQEPYNPWAANDLGILLRNDKKYKEAIQCFNYGYSFNDTFQIIKCNMAWAAAYYGDFINAKKAFREILARIPGYNSAWEGLGMIAYQEGDLATLWESMTKQIKTVGAGGNGPSEEFTGFVDGVEQEAAADGMGSPVKADAPDNNAMDSGNGEDAENQDPPPTADNEPPNYPSMGGMFAQGIDQMEPLLYQIKSNHDIISQKDKQAQDRVANIRKTLTRLAPAPYTDDQGALVTPYSYQKFYTLFNLSHKEFEKRASRAYSKYDEDWKKLESSLSAQRASFDENSSKEYLACKSEEEVHEFYCKWVPKAKGFLGQNLMGVSQMWTSHFVQLKDEIDWYVSASTPYIKRMHKTDWNDYMNAIREYDVRHAVMHFYHQWIVAQGLATDGAATVLIKQEVVCTTPVREIAATGPDPKDIKLKKLKTFPDYCDKKAPGTSIDCPFASYEDNCDHTRLLLKIPTPFKVGATAGMGPLKSGVSAGLDVGLVLEKVKGKKFKEDEYYNVGMAVSLGVEVSTSASAKGTIGSYSPSMGTEVKASAQITLEGGYRFGSDGSLQGKYIDAGVSAGITGESKWNAGVPTAGQTVANASSSQSYKTEVFAQRTSDGSYSSYRPR